MRFCMVTTFYPPTSFGGDAIFIARLAEALVRRGHEVDVIHCVDSYRALGGTARDSAPGGGVRRYALRSGMGALAPLAAHQTGFPLVHARRLRHLLAEGRHDVVHFHNISLLGPAVLRYGGGVKLLTLHDHWTVCPQHTLFRMNRELCVRRTCIRCALAYRRPPQWWRWSRLLRHSLRRVHCVVAPSRAARERHERDGIEARIEHLPHFVPEPPAADETACRTLSDRPYFLFVGRLERLKGLQTLIPLFRTRSDLMLLVAGDGTYRPELERLAAGAPNVRFAGWLSGGALTAAYQRATALIVPSLTCESFTLVTVEAMAVGTPVVARRLGAPAEIAAEGGGFTYGTDAELVGVLDRLQSSATVRAERGRLAREAYLRNWTEDIHLRRYFDLIARLQDRTPGAPARVRAYG